MTSEPAIELRVLYGPQAGSRLTLASDEYLLGTSDECAIILTGPLLEEEHAVLSFNGTEPRIKPLDGRVYDAQGNEIADEIGLTLGMPVELGGIWIAVDHADAPWPDPQAVAPMPAKNSRPSSEERASSADADSDIESASDDENDNNVNDENDNNNDRDNSDDLPVEETVSAQIVENPGNKSFYASQKSRFPRQRAFYLIIFVVLIISGSILAAVLGGQNASAEKKATTATTTATSATTSATAKAPAETIISGGPPPKALSDLIRSFAPASTLSTNMEDGEWVVSGYVPTFSIQKTLTERLSALTPAPVLRVIVDEALVANANKFLATRSSSDKLTLQADNSKGGILHLTGAALNPDILNAVIELLRTEVSGIKRIETTVAFPDDLKARLREQLEVARLSNQLTFSQSGAEVVLTGKLTEEETARWETLFIKFSQSYGNILPIRASITPAVTGTSLRIMAVVSGPIPYIVTDKGERINQGGALNGQTLISIKENEVVFEGNQRLRISR